MFNDSILYTFRGPMRIPVEIHNSYIMLVVLILLVSATSNLLFGAIFLVMLTLSIFAHELGHAWGAKAQGIPVRRIVLHGGGGFMESQRAGTPKQQEFVVAMGPLVNLILWAIASSLSQTGLVTGLGGGLLSAFAMLNLFLFIFNLMPMPPLDGGKLLQLVLMRFTKPLYATRITGGVALVAGVLWIPAAIWLLMSFGFILLFIPNFPLFYQMWKMGR